MRKTLPVVVVLLFAGARSQAQSSAVVAAADFGAQPDPAIPAAPAQFGIGGNPQAPGGGAVPFGNGEEPVLRFAGDNGPQNEFTFGLGASVGYDDNTYGSNTGRYGDYYTGLGPRVSFITARKRVTFNFAYVASFQINDQYASADSLNQTLAFDAETTVSRRLQLRARNATTESYYGLFGGTAAPTVPGLATPGEPVPYLVNPGARTIGNTDRVDLLFSKSGRTMIDVFGSYFLRTVNNQGGGANINFNDIQGGNAGWSYRYRSSARGSLSATYAYTISRYSSGGSRYANQNLMLSYAYQLSQSVSISVYGGPEYTYLNETLPAQTIGGLPTSIHKPEWDWSAGFSASATTNRTTFFLAGSRAVSSAGGLLAAVNSDFGSLGVSRRLPWNWTGTMTVGYGEYQALKFGGLQNGKITTGVGNISFGHQLGERLTLGLRYNYTQQRGSVSGVAGLAAGYENLNRNVASIGIDWAIGKYHLGH